MKTHTIIIQGNTFNAIQIPTTQVDNFGDVAFIYDLYHKYHTENNGNETKTKHGHMVIWYDETISVYIGHIAFNFNKDDYKIY